MGVVATDAFELVPFQRHRRLEIRPPVADVRLDAGIAQFPVRDCQCAVIGEGNRVIVGEIHTDLAGKTSGLAQALGDGIAGADARAGKIDAGIFDAIEHVHLAQGQGTVMAG